jgi:hypothetical protein
MALASFYAASRVAVHGAMVLTEASAAGMMLHMHRDCGDAIRACAAMPLENEPEAAMRLPSIDALVAEDRSKGGGSLRGCDAPSKHRQSFDWSRVARAIAQVAIDEDVADRPLRAVQR